MKIPFYQQVLKLGKVRLENCKTLSDYCVNQPEVSTKERIIIKLTKCRKGPKMIIYVIWENRNF